MASSMRGGRTRKFKSEINVVPYIDVMLVLLVIFMVVAPLTTPGVVNLPSAEKTAQPPSEYIEVTMRDKDSYEIGVKQQKQGRDQPDKVGRDALMQKLTALHAQNPDYAVLISADKESNYGDVIKLISDAKKVGIARVGLATK
jgi:biopolymer transport protein TolR